MKKPQNNSPNTSYKNLNVKNLLGPETQKPTLGQEIVSYNGAKWIPWGADKGNSYGLYPNRIAETFQNSKTLRGVLTQKSKLVAASLKTESRALQTKIDRLVSPSRHYDLRELIYRVALDIQLHGEGFIKEVRHVEYVGDTPVKERSFAQHLDATNVRFASEVDEDLNPVAVYISRNWAHYTRKEYRPYRVPLAPYGYEEFQDLEGKVYKKVTIHRIVSWDSGLSVYGRADWTSSFYSAQLESILARWNYTHLTNSIHLSGILNIELPFAPDEDTAKELRDKIRENLKGINSGGPSTPIQITGGDGKLSLLQYNLPQDGAFKDLNRTCERDIIMACSWHPSLMGVEEAGKLGNVREVENHHKRAMESEIKPLQERILSTYLNTLEGTSFYELALDYPITFENKPLFTVLDYVSQAKIDNVVPDSEIAKELGLVQEEEVVNDTMKMSVDELKQTLEVYGTAVRAGGVTPNIDDEAAIRKLMNLPPVNDSVRQGWEKEGGTKKPTTIKSEGEE